MEDQIISSLLDVDLYKYSMGQCVYHQFPDAQVEYEFNCRTPNVNLSQFKDEICDQIYQLKHLFLISSEIKFLTELPYLKSDFIEFLRLLRLNPEKYVNVQADKDNLQITIKGEWLYTIWFETLILSIVSEIYGKSQIYEGWEKRGNEKFLDKIRNNKPNPLFRLIEFGTRRRFSLAWQRNIIEKIISDMGMNFLVGTSNVLLAMEYNLKPIGTAAHEWTEAMQAIYHPINSQRMALANWIKEYRGDLGIALTDTLGVDAFLRDFDMYFATVFQGVRQDSGNPYEFTEKMLNHYRKLGIDPMTKKIIYSDGLDIDSAMKLCNTYQKDIQMAFGIGTKLTNDIPDIKPLNIVIKMTKCNGQPVAKISDSPGKQICHDEEYLKYLKKIFNIK